ncbi:hypothetical protein [Dermatophilus congolensis]|uniref:EamA-like transporter family n=2 Tax=Dermatophilus congolensis TaxID=1863 RepID=A0A239V6F4_9MICO|nr:Uncharacterised protein [Dermatophilus congolensis]
MPYQQPSLLFMILSTAALALGVLAYGIGGAQLSTGSKDEGSPLASKTWWIGTCCQGLGFVFTLAARQTLPLLIVQACIVGGLAVTAIIEHASGRRRIAPLGWASIGAVVLGITILAATTVPGTVPPTGIEDLAVVAAVVAICLIAFFLPLPPSVSGVFGGTGFAISAIAARLIVADHSLNLIQPWTWPWTTWAAGILLMGGLVLGQMHLTRGLAQADGVTVLSTNYLMSTLVPAAYGLIMLNELPRAGTYWLVPIGLVTALLGAYLLIRKETPGIPEELTP